MPTPRSCRLILCETSGLEAYSAGGTKALKHGNVRSNRAKPAEVRKRVLQLVREHYSGEPHERFGPTLAAEHLWTDHDLGA